MAQEIRASGTLSITANGFTVTGNASQTFSLTGSQYDGHVQNVGTSYETLALGDLTDIRAMFLKNISTASISVALHSASSSFAVIRPDGFLYLEPSASFTGYVLKSTSAGADVQVVMTET